MRVNYSKERYLGLNYIEKELAKSIDSLSEKIKEKLGIEVIYFDKEATKKCGVSRIGFFPHVSEGVYTKVSTWNEIKSSSNGGKKLVYIKKVLESNKIYGVKNIKGDTYKIRPKTNRSK